MLRYAAAPFCRAATLACTAPALLARGGSIRRSSRGAGLALATPPRGAPCPGQQRRACSTQAAPLAEPCDCGLTAEDLGERLAAYKRHLCNDGAALPFAREMYEEDFRRGSEASPACRARGRPLAEHPAKTLAAKALDFLGDSAL
jgi:hypothetical protein